MARIRIVQRAAGLLVVLRGRLTAADMGRLEQACAPALVSDPLQLEIDLRHVTHTDSTAAAVLERMVARGAVLTTLAGQLL
jgi:anti-anti-sigma regulatory factor